MDKTALLNQLDALLAEYQTLKGRSRHDDLSDLPVESNALVVRMRAAIDRMTLPSMAYAREAKAVDGKEVHRKLPLCAGIIQALRADLDQGWMESVAELLHGDTFTDFLDQADELVTKHYKDPAAVLAGSVLEAHLRLMCIKFQVPIQTTSGAPKKADAMNSDLVKASAYNTVRQKAITAWLGIRNSAAHGNYGDYDEAAVKNMISSIGDFIAAHPA